MKRYDIQKNSQRMIGSICVSRQVKIDYNGLTQVCYDCVITMI